MKIVLNDYVEHLGDPGDKVEVAKGYARNYLFPKKLAFEATPENLRTYENNLRQRARKITKIIKGAEDLKAKLDGEEALVYIRKAGEEGKIFGSVTGADIEETLKERGYSIEKKRIAIHLPIKSLGLAEVIVKLHKNVTATITVEVRPEAVEETKPEDEESMSLGDEPESTQAGEDNLDEVESPDQTTVQED